MVYVISLLNAEIRQYEQKIINLALTQNYLPQKGNEFTFFRADHANFQFRYKNMMNSPLVDFKMRKELTDNELEIYSRQVVLSDIGYDGQVG